MRRRGVETHVPSASRCSRPNRFTATCQSPEAPSTTVNSPHYELTADGRTAVSDVLPKLRAVSTTAEHIVELTTLTPVPNVVPNCTRRACPRLAGRGRTSAQGNKFGPACRCVARRTQTPHRGTMLRIDASPQVVDSRARVQQVDKVVIDGRKEMLFAMPWWTVLQGYPPAPKAANRLLNLRFDELALFHGLQSAVQSPKHNLGSMGAEYRCTPYERSHGSSFVTAAPSESAATRPASCSDSTLPTS